MKKAISLFLFLILTNLISSQTFKTDVQSAEDILNNYYIAIAGSKTNLESIKSISLKGRINLPQSPEAFPFTIKFQNPNKIITSITFMGTTIKQGYDGVNAISSMNSLPKEQIEKLKNQNGYFPELFYNNGNTSYSSITIVNGIKVYKLTSTNHNGNTKSTFFDTNTGLKIKEEGSIGNNSIVTFYSDYKKFGNYTFPSKIEINTDNQKVIQKITEYTINPKLTDNDFK